MSSTTRQRVIVTGILLAIGLLMVAAGVAIALAEGRHLVASLITTVVAIAAFVVLLRTDTGLLVRILSGLRLLLPIVAFSLTTILMGKTAGTVRFDEVGAQVIIVLLLALAIDARFFRLRAGSDRLDVSAILFTMLLLAVGEYYALKGLLGARSTSAETIAGSIAAGFTAVAVTAMAGAESAKN
ncbi:MAG TPA: hypothetical protein VFL77_05175 [Solirubrobacterales bacterium]|nr:hypothetical protein [Solirubrobacterales bacterium]